jgi:NADPH-dependent 2,4-dienoyl-CoA reductase/sulfur reductase-like enzyme/nitrite reductase/ring-hydroxylating ferredoxin subunit
MTEDKGAVKPDLAGGVANDALADGGMLAGVVGDEDVLLARRGDEFFAVGAQCTHYHAPLSDGLIAGDTLRCPWHHACFSLRTGEALRAPALDPIDCWRVEKRGRTIFVREKMAHRGAKQREGAASGAPASVIIVGGGAAGLAAADMLRREGYEGRVTLISADDAPPCDRPNLSKDYLAGTAQEDWIPLRAPGWYTERDIGLVLNSRASSLDLNLKRVMLENGATIGFDALLIATGADPVRLPIAGAEDARVHTLRTFADARAIVAAAANAKRVIVVGASFIALEVAASLRARQIEVHVVAPDKTPLERVMGAQVGAFIRNVHEAHGVVFHLGLTLGRLDADRATLSDGSVLEADFVVLGVGVRPAIALAEQAGLAIDRGVSVDEYLETSAPGVFAAGDIARWPDVHSGERIRVEHWVLAQRQGQVAAKNILGRRVRFDAVPFFWSQHYDLAINYVGHAQQWDDIEIEGSLADGDCAVTYKRGQRPLAVATLHRDLVSLRAELAMEQTLARSANRT